MPATMTVVTGRHPHTRAQFWWRLVDAERDGAAIKALGELEAPGVKDLLRAALLDESSLVRQQAVRAARPRARRR